MNDTINNYEPVSRSLRTPSLKHFQADQKRQEIRRYFLNTYTLYESLFDLICSDNAYFIKAEPLRHPLIFYFGHTAVFYINKLYLAGYLKQRINPEFESIFAIGVDEMSWDDLNEAHYNWPSIAELKVYREQVKDCVLQQINHLPLGNEITWNDPFWVILMGIEHDRIHLETSSVIIRQLPLETVRSHNSWPSCKVYGKAPQNSLIEVPDTHIKLGKTHQDDYYGWDNEYG